MTPLSVMLRGLTRAAAGQQQRIVLRNMSGASNSYAYKHLEVTQPSEFVFRCGTDYQSILLTKSRLLFSLREECCGAGRQKIIIKDPFVR
jgi:hypothetical protein